MEQWEHINVNGTVDLRARETPVRFPLRVVQPDGAVEDWRESSTTPDVVAILNRFGRDGWQLVSADEQEHGGFLSRSYWMRRRIS